MANTTDGPRRRQPRHAGKTGGPLDFLVGGGEMGERIRSFDWRKTQLGPIEQWSSALRMMVSFLLANRFPLLLWWGPQYVSIYNDAYRPVLGMKHPKALGQPVSECWSEIWHILQPLIDTPFQGGPATWMDDISLEINRHRFVEETHFTIAYSPVPDETVPSGIGGVLATVHEITEKVVGERRVVALRDLGTRAMEAKTAEDACAVAAKTLTQAAKDIPFALFYLLDADGKRARLAGSAGVGGGSRVSPPVLELGADAEDQSWPMAEVMRTETMQVVEDLADCFGAELPPGPWSDPPRQAVVVPIRSNIAHQLAGFLVAGVSCRLKLDELYRSFYELVAGQIATAVANARVYEEERKRAEALAELDRAKTAFFSNVSHEFRTPLTLMLGPVEDLLASAEPLPSGVREQLAVTHRNSLRLLKLVNTLLDFSRIEAGRVQASYEPTDLAAFTAELASVFRSAIEKAGLQLIVDCPPLPEPVYVDREMWEKIVLNVISNAFKFTFEGTITVALRLVGNRVELSVADTGVGIPEGELPKIFERFHRVRGARSRTHEGTGIGLALVQELARLHGGDVTAQSGEGRGSTFTVGMRTGFAHLPPDRINAERTQASIRLGVAPYVDEALRWLPDEPNSELGMLNAELPDSRIHNSEFTIQNAAKPRVLVADDNADMREYVRRLLVDRYDVTTVADGETALATTRRSLPDLVLADVMMPRLDGFGLLRELRGDPATKMISVILLSARAGEESRVEGLEQGADDYLIKPFSARELLARVEAHLKMAKLRTHMSEVLRESDARFRAFADNAPAMLWVTEADDSCSFLSRGWYEFTGQNEKEGLGFGWLDAVHQNDCAAARQTFRAATAKHQVFELEYRLRRADGEYRWAIDTGRPRFGPGGTFLGYIGSVLDIAERKQTEEALRASEERLRYANTELSQRIAELQEANAKVQNSHRAALNLMEDAVRSSQAMETLNLELRESEQRYRTLFELGPVAIYSCDTSGVINKFNRRAAELWGREPALGDTDERFCGSFKLFRPDGSFMPHEQCPMAEVVSGTISEVRDAEVLIERPDSSRVTVVVNICPLKNQRGEVTGAINCFYDITERKRLEARLRDFNAQLEQRVEDRTCEIRTSQERLRALAADLNLAEQRERQRLAVDLHDYLAQLLALTKIKLGQAKQQSMASPMAQALTDMQDVMDQALTYTRTLVAQLSPPVLKQFGLPMALKWLAEQMQQRNLTVSLELESESLPLPEDQAMLLFQSIRELLMNVVKHADTTSARITMAKVQGTVHITVADQGAGFDLAAADRSRSAPGFGLFSIRERMLALGGRFELESRPGEGTTATLVLPFGNTRAPSSELEVMSSELQELTRHSELNTQNSELPQRIPDNSKLRTQNSELRAPAKIRVLLADDHKMVRQGLRSILDAYQDIAVIGEAADGEEAVELVRRLSPDVVVMDVNMPRVDGIEATRRIKTQQPATLIVGLSLSKANQVEPLLLQTGASSFVSKDSAAEHLYEAIMTVMKR